jgi:hypothetical protein
MRCHGRRRPRSPCKSGMASTRESARHESLRLAPVSWITNGIPFPSQITWRLPPGLARSVGGLSAAPKNSSHGTTVHNGS